MRSWVLRSPQRERNASRSRSSRYCSLTSDPAVTLPPAQNVGHPARDLLVVFRSETRLAHHKDAGFSTARARQCRERESGRADAARCNPPSARAMACALASSRRRSRLRVMRSAGASRPESARFGGGGGDLGHGDGFEGALEGGLHFGGLGEAGRRVARIGRREGGGGIDGAQQHLLGAAAAGDQADAGLDQADVGFGIGLAARGVEADLGAAAQGHAEGATTTGRGQNLMAAVICWKPRMAPSISSHSPSCAASRSCRGWRPR